MAYTYKKYEESDAVKAAREKADSSALYNASDSVTRANEALTAHEANRPTDWTGGEYGAALKGAIDKINNREKFTYDLNGDALYQQYKNQYMQQGKLAMQDAMGQAAALTGGYGNSYAATVGNQTYQGYLSKLNDVVPELYQMAYDQYNRETEDLYNRASLYNTMNEQEYGRYRDTVSDWQTEAARLQDRYYNEASLDYSRYADQRDYLANAYNDAYNRDYGLYSDEYNRGLAAYQQDVAEAADARDYALQVAKFNESQRQYDTSLAEEQRQYNATLAENKRQFDAQMNAKELAAKVSNEGGFSKTSRETMIKTLAEFKANGDNDGLWAYLYTLYGMDNPIMTKDQAYELYKKYVTDNDEIDDDPVTVVKPEKADAEPAGRNSYLRNEWLKQQENKKSSG